MKHAKPEYAISITLIGVFLAMGIPSIRSGRLIIGGICTTVAVLIAGWSILALIRERR